LSNLADAKIVLKQRCALLSLGKKAAQNLEYIVYRDGAVEPPPEARIIGGRQQS
jgi:hypothetical protein